MVRGGGVKHVPAVKGTRLVWLFTNFRQEFKVNSQYYPIRLRIGDDNR